MISLFAVNLMKLSISLMHLSGRKTGAAGEKKFEFSSLIIKVIHGAHYTD